MNVVSDEVFAVILAIVVVGSVVSVATLLRPEVTEPFVALGLLDKDCKIGSYPELVVAGGDLDLCLYIFNYKGYPVLAQVRYKIGRSNEIPTNTTPANLKTLKNFTRLLNHNEEVLIRTKVPVVVNESLVRGNVTLIFELWVYEASKGEWVYSGVWTDLHVEVTGVR